MRFRVALILILFTPGCGYKVFNQAPGQAPLAITGVPTSCLSGFSAKVSGYLDGTREAQDIQGLGQCLDQALGTFVTKTRGARAGVYSSEELRTFLNKFFTADSPIPQPLFAEFMKVKQAAVGGETTGFTDDEISKTRVDLKSLTAALVALAPVTPDTVRSFSGALASILEGSQHSYDLADGKALLKELEHWSANTTVKQAYDNFSWAKAAYILLFPSGGPAQKIQAQDWRGVLDAAADAYEVHWYVTRATGSPAPWNRGRAREEWLEVARRARLALQKVANRSQGQVLQFATLNRALETVYPKTLQLFGDTVSTTNVETFISLVFGKLLGPGKGVREAGIDSPLLDRALSLAENFSSAQAFLEEKFAGHGLGRIAPADFFGTDAQGILSDLSSVASKLPGSLDPQQTGDLVLPGSANQVPYGMGLTEFEDLLWRENVASTIIHGYAGSAPGEQAPVPRSLLEGELVQLYMDARPLGLELKLFDPVDLSAPSKRFRDASIFLFPSNGDERLDLAETTELIRYLITGKKLGDSAHRSVANHCQTGPLDPYGFVTIEPNCYRREYYGHVSTFWAALPASKRYYASLSSANQAEYGRLLEQVARKKTDPQAWFDSDDSESIATLAEYVETFFTRFDRNGDGQLSGQELEAVYELVDGQLQRLSCVKIPVVRRALFNYLVRYGQAPDRTILGTARFLALWGTEVFQYFSADRLQIFRILSELMKSQADSCSQTQAQASRVKKTMHARARRHAAGEWLRLA